MKPRSHRTLLSRLAVLAGLLAATGPASAQDDAARRAAAQALFDEAQQLLKVRDFARACPKLEEVNNLQPGKIGALMELGSCYEQWGKTTSAWARYRTAADLATKAADPRKPEADAKVAALAPLVPRLVVVVPDSMRTVAGLVIETDGVPLGPAAWGTGIPVDPGAHEVSASAPDKRKWSTKVEVNRPGENITVTIPALTGGDEGGGEATKTGGWSGQHTAAVVLAGAGLVSFGVMAGFGADAAQKHSASNPHCSTDRRFCDPTGLDLEKQAHSSANVSNGMLAAGAALVAAGVVVFVLAPSMSSKETPKTTARISSLSFRAGGGPGAVAGSIQGEF